MNHVSGARSNVTDAVYNQYDGDAEKRKALRLWAIKLHSIVRGKSWRVRWYA